MEEPIIFTKNYIQMTHTLRSGFANAKWIELWHHWPVDKSGSIDRSIIFSCLESCSISRNIPILSLSLHYRCLLIWKQMGKNTGKKSNFYHLFQQQKEWEISKLMGNLGTWPLSRIPKSHRVLFLRWLETGCGAQSWVEQKQRKQLFCTQTMY